MTKDSPAGFQTTKGCVALVTGSSGLCGARLVEMLLERGASTVLCFDIHPLDDELEKRFAKYTKDNLILQHLGKENGDLCSEAAVERAFQALPRIDVVYHLAALVGPFHDRDKYYDVNVTATLRLIDMCKKYQVPKLVFSSSPSTRFTGKDVAGLREDQMEIPQKFLALYAETKAKAEIAVLEACTKNELMTIAVAPHQVYGPYDKLFVPNLLSTAGNGRLRIFGKGDKLISVCYSDNYAHGLMCAADALQEGSPALGKFYIVTDGKPQNFWDFINQAIIAMGFVDLHTKKHLPVWLLYGVAYVCNVIGFLLGKKLKLNPFNVCMLTIHRYFSIENAKRDLDYEPIVPIEESWPSTIEWYKTNWLPGFLEEQKAQKR